MNFKQIGLLFLLADFSALTAYALYYHGYVGLFELHMANSAGVQVIVDLVLALTFFMLWMWNDARERGISPIPFTLLTLTLGSIGMLAYLVRRESAPAESRAMSGHAVRA